MEKAGADAKTMKYDLMEELYYSKIISMISYYQRSVRPFYFGREKWYMTKEPYNKWYP
jgi:hypothetical protein